MYVHSPFSKRSVSGHHAPGGLSGKTLLNRTLILPSTRFQSSGRAGGSGRSSDIAWHMLSCSRVRGPLERWGGQLKRLGWQWPKKASLGRDHRTGVCERGCWEHGEG